MKTWLDNDTFKAGSHFHRPEDLYEIPDKEETRCKKVFVDSTGNKKETAVKHEMKKWSFMPDR